MLAEVLWPYSLQKVMMEKDREDQLARSCETWRSITKGQVINEYRTDNKKKKG